jgi:hypothetical protein
MPPTDFKSFVGLILDLINLAIPLLIGIVFLIFAWKIFDSWVIHADDEKKVESGKQLVVVAVIVFVIMVSVWGIVSLLRNSLFGF